MNEQSTPGAGSEQNGSGQSQDHAGVKFPPPLYPLLGRAIGYGIGRVEPPTLSQFGPDIDWTMIGWVLTAIGAALLVPSNVMFFLHKTNILPMKPTSTLMQGGIYRITRNPIYLSFVVLQAGIGVWMNNVWVVALAAVTWACIHRFVIPREEAYLTRAFGDEYTAYTKKVRRWI